MENKDFDKNIKGLFDEFSPEIDTDALWENVEPHLEKKKRRRYLLLVFFFGLAGLGWLGFGDAFFVENANLAEQKSAIVKEESFDKKINSPEIAQPILSEDDSKIISEDATKNLVTSEVRTSSSSVSNSNKKSTQTVFLEKVEEPSVQKNTINSKGTTKRENKKFHSKNINSVTSENDFKSKSNQSENSNLSTDSAPTDTFAEEAVTEFPSTLQKTTEPKIENIEEESPIESSEKALAEAPEKVEKERKKKKLSKKKKRKKKKKSKKKKRKKIKRTKSVKWRPYAQFFTAPEYAARQLSSRTGNDNSPFLQSRKDAEKALDSYNSGLNFQLIHKGGLVLFSGMEYRQINERLKLEYNTVDTVVERGVVAIIVNSLGDTTDTEYGLKTKVKKTSSNQRFYSSYRFLNLPLGFGYHKKGRKFGYKILGGVNINLAFFAEGSFLNSSGNPQSFEHSTLRKDNFGKMFKQKLSASYWLSYEYYRNINYRTSWMIAPRIELPGSSLTHLENPFIQKYYNFGLKAGINVLLIEDKKSKKRRLRRSRKK